MKRSTLHSLRAPLCALALASGAVGLAASGSVLAAAPGAAAPALAPAVPAAPLTVAQTAVPAVASVPAGSVVPVVATAPNSLQSISVQSINGAQVQLILHMSAPATAPLGFAIDKPARISFDLPNTTLALPSRRIDVGTGGVDTILAAEANGRSRLVLDLDQPMAYATRVQGDDIVVTVGGAGGGAAHAQETRDNLARGVVPTAATSEPREIRSIDFRRSPTGAAQLVVRLSDPHTPIDLKQQGTQIIVDFAGTALPRRLSRRYDTLDFGTPVTGFEAERVDGNTRIVLDASGGFEQLAYQTDNQYVVEVNPVKQTAAAGPAEIKKSYNGERLTLNFQNISTRAVLQLLADASGQNIVVSDSVNGNVTLRLQNVPWDQALDIVLTTKGLGKRQDGNVIIVAPAEELAAREKADLASQQDIQQLEPLHSEYLQVNYAKAADIASLLKGKGASSLLSSRGSVSVDDRTNTLLVSDTSDHIADIRRLVATLDIPVKQVEIEARIVVVSNDFERQLGSILGVTATHANGSNGLYETTGTASGIDTGVSSAISNLSSNGSVYPVNIPTGSGAVNRYNVNLPVSSPAGSIAFGILGADYLVDLELSAAQTENLATVVSSPRVITANQQEAQIKQGVEIPYQESASSGATTIAFKDAVLLLKVKPLITPDNRIILDLMVSDDEVGQTVVASGGVNVPAIDTRAVQTQVLLNDGETVVLGGILQTNKTKSATKIPFLGDIPVLGNLFKTTDNKDDKDELLIFVTPKILREGSVATG
ncbi:MAG TPA: type IV pilus secretin PilQ [Steroidobacteraceae bacterium]|nr:type IV pilus secretin PilQ [Steroidobacteraceae bacterium]